MRGDIDEQHKIRMEAFEFKMQPIVINEEPSRKVSLNILLFNYYSYISKGSNLLHLGKLQDSRC